MKAIAMGQTIDDKRAPAEAPLYRQLAATLRQQLEDGRFGTNAALPAERRP